MTADNKCERGAGSTCADQVGKVFEGGWET